MNEPRESKTRFNWHWLWIICAIILVGLNMKEIVNSPKTKGIIYGSYAWYNFERGSKDGGSDLTFDPIYHTPLFILNRNSSDTGSGRTKIWVGDIPGGKKGILETLSQSPDWGTPENLPPITYYPIVPIFRFWVDNLEWDGKYFWLGKFTTWGWVTKEKHTKIINTPGSIQKTAKIPGLDVSFRVDAGTIEIPYQIVTKDHQRPHNALVVTTKLKLDLIHDLEKARLRVETESLQVPMDLPNAESRLTGPPQINPEPEDVRVSLPDYLTLRGYTKVDEVPIRIDIKEITGSVTWKD